MAKVKRPHVSRQGIIQSLRKHKLYTPKVQRAHRLAIKTHSKQRRYDGSPYLEQHIYPVVQELLDYFNHMRRKHDPEIIISAFLHDVLEDDLSMTETEFKRRFGKKIYDNVKILTKPMSYRNVPRKRFLSINAQFWNAIKKAGEKMVLVKLADRVNNLESDLNLKHIDPDRIRKDIELVQRNYLAYCRKHYPYFYERFASLIAELKAMMK